MGNVKRRVMNFERQMAALRLAMKGYTYPEIAAELGYNSKQAAHKAVKTALDKATVLEVESAKSMALLRLDAMTKGIFDFAEAGVGGAIDRVLKIEERRAKLIGLDAPVKTTEVLEAEQVQQRVSIPAYGIAPPFLAAYRDILAHNHTEYVFKGGRGSTKSTFVSLVIIELLIGNPEWHVLVTRQVQNTLRDSVYAQLVWAINYLGLESQFLCTVSPLEITYLPTRQKIYFRGADDPLKIKSLKPRFGYVNIVWFEELDQFPGAAHVRSILQSAIRGGDKAYIFKSYNPPRTRNNWVHKELEFPKENRYVHESDYTTVPREWLGQAFIDEAEFLKQVNPDAYEHEYMGVANSAGGLVFENVSLREITEAEIAQFDRIHEGLDFGYYPDPLHWLKMYYDRARLTLYIFDEYRAWKTSNRDLYKALVDEKGYTPEQVVIGDSAEPKSIADLREYGMSIRPAEKGADSVTYSHKWLQSLKAIIIDPKRCPDAAEEFVNYEYDTDPDGNYISVYPDANNHGIDAARYGMNHEWRRRGK